MRNVKLLYIITVLQSALFCLPYLIPYAALKADISFQYFMMTEVAFAATVLLLEVPTGYLSDIWRRKTVLVLSILFWIASFTAFVYVNSLWVLLIGQVCSAISVSLSSGTIAAMLYDSLLSEDKQDNFARIEGKRHAIRLYSIASSAVLGGFLYSYHPSLPFYVTIVMGMIALVFALMLKEPARIKQAVKGNPFKDMLSTIQYAVHGHAEVALIILFSTVIFTATKLVFWIQQPFYLEIGLPEAWLGTLLAVGWIIGGIGSQLGHKLDGKISNIRFLTLLFLMLLIANIVCALFTHIGLAIALIGISTVYGIATPKVTEAINKRVGSERRATIISTQNLLIQLCFIPVSLLAGQVTEGSQTQNAFWVIIGWLMLGGLCLMVWEYLKAKKRLTLDT